MFKIFKKNIWTDNPVFAQVLTLCPVLAMTTSVQVGIAMGIAYTAAMTLTGILISIFSRFIPDKVRRACFIIIIAGVVTVVQIAMLAFAPVFHAALGVFIPLIAVNCLVVGRAEAFASRNNPIRSAVDGFAAGLGLTLALMVLAVPRELLGNGSIAGFNITPDTIPNNMFMLVPPGGFIALGLIMGGISWIKLKRDARGAN